MRNIVKDWKRRRSRSTTPFWKPAERNGETWFRTGPVAARIGQQFAIRRLTDWERSGPYIAEGYVGERIEQLIADGRLITAQTRYGQGLRTATEAELEMAENADPMQMHF